MTRHCSPLRRLRPLGGRRALAAVASVAAASVAIALWTAHPALACAGLVTASGNVRVETTTTLAAHHDGVEHYITSFTFQGGGGEFGSLVPLPGLPTGVERGGEWTLQRLERELNRGVAVAGAAAASGGSAQGDAVVVQQVRIDALDLTILKGGGQAVGKWAEEHGFGLTPDAPAVLEFYAARSPYFLAAIFDAAAAEQQGQQRGEGTPVHLTIPTENPWVPLRILGLGRPAEEFITASVFLLADTRPVLLHGNTPGFNIVLDELASPELLNDLRADKGMDWVPEHMHLVAIRLGEEQSRLTYDLATDVSGAASPSPVAAGLVPPTTTTTTAPPPTDPPTTAPPSTVATTVATTVPPGPTGAVTELAASPASLERRVVGSLVAAVLVAAVGLIWMWRFRASRA